MKKAMLGAGMGLIFAITYLNFGIWPVTALFCILFPFKAKLAALANS